MRDVDFAVGGDADADAAVCEVWVKQVVTVTRAVEPSGYGDFGDLFRVDPAVAFVLFVA